MLLLMLLLMMLLSVIAATVVGVIVVAAAGGVFDLAIPGLLLYLAGTFLPLTFKNVFLTHC